MQLVTAALLLPALALANPVALRQAKPPADEIKIISAQSSGNGCPQGSVSSTISPDRTVRSPSRCIRNRQPYLQQPGRDIWL